MSVVSSSVREALAHFERVDGCKPDTFGSNSPSLQRLRALVASISNTVEVAGSICFIAPHTHWENVKPIVLRRMPQSYILGQLNTHDDFNTYFPITFLHHRGEFVPYEWIEKYTGLPELDYYEVYKLVAQLAEVWPDNTSHIGLTVNHRFKNSPLTNGVINTVEIDSGDRGLPDGWLRILQSNIETSDIQVEQIGWPVFNSEIPEISLKGNLIANDLTLFLGSMSAQERMRTSG